MADYRRIINIDNSLREYFRETERYFSIILDMDVIDRIFKDSEEDQVNEKKYLIFNGKLARPALKMMIYGFVEEYEPKSVHIEFLNIKRADLKFLS